MLKPLTERDHEVLQDLASVNAMNTRALGEPWAKPMDIGAWNSSYHSGVLKKLARRGLVEVEDASAKRPGCSRFYRSGCRYQVSDAGRAALGSE